MLPGDDGGEGLRDGGGLGEQGGGESRGGRLEDGQQVGRGRGDRHNPSGAVEGRGQGQEGGRGLGLGVVQHRLDAVVGGRDQLGLLVRHRLEDGGAPEVDRDNDRLQGGGGGQEGAGVGDQLGIWHRLYGRATS